MPCPLRGVWHLRDDLTWSKSRAGLCLAPGGTQALGVLSPGITGLGSIGVPSGVHSGALDWVVSTPPLEGLDTSLPCSELGL